MEMVHDDQISVIVDACLDANKLIQECGTDTMKTLIHVLLFEIGQEIARRQVALQKQPGCD